MQSSLQSVDKAVPTTPAAAGKSEGGGEKAGFREKVRKAGEEAISFFQNHMTVTSVIYLKKKRVKYTVLKIQ